MVQLSKAAFLDRDGVINRDKDKGYIFRRQDFEFLDGVFEACRRLNELGFKIIVVTNQSGIGRGYYTDEQFHVLNRWMLQRFREEGAPLTDVYYCPYHPEGKGEYRKDSPYRKPGPQMLLDAAEDYGLDMAASFMVGDKQIDVQAGRAAGAGRCYFIRGKEELPPEYADVKQFESLAALVRGEFGR
ncbi:MAG TPA: HAD family hydrolase [Gammaproteobacteria bacterium]|nr:HAD family hydrolase [Gammaproteobacteria bacterium]